MPFKEKMAQLTATLKDQFTEGERLETEIGKNLAGLAMCFRNMVGGQE
ncbi:MAG: hypothetical protein GY850_33725 [bacterium]|nr:hypothetical protein [bacterium]